MDFNFKFAAETLIIAIKAIPVSLKIVIVSVILAFIPAFIIAITRIKKIKVLSQLFTLFVSANRGFPIMIQVLIVYSFVPYLLNTIFSFFKIKINIYDLNPIIYAYIVFTLTSIASLSEIFRASLQTISKGQYEAGLSIGLSAFQTYSRVIIPQTLVSAVPNICNTVVGLLKSTSLAYYMTIKDITGAAMTQASIGYNFIEAYLDVFAIYIVLCAVTQFLFQLLERYLDVGKNGGIKPKSAFYKLAA